MTRPQDHPFGGGVGAYLAGRELLRAKTAQMAENVRKELLKCHGGSSCPAGVHHPSCERAQPLGDDHG